MFNIQAKQFEEALMHLINTSGLKVSEAYYIVENAALQLKIAYEQIIASEMNNKDNMQSHEKEFVVNDIGKEEKENEGTDTDASEHSGSTNDN